MPELDDVTVLVRLVDAADRVLNRVGMLSEEFEELAAEIKRRRSLPPGDPQIIADDALMLIMALRNCQRTRSEAWGMIGGALLPMVRASLSRGMEARRTIASRSDPDSQPNYRGARR